MFKDSICISRGNSEKISQRLEQVTFNAVRKILPDHTIMQAYKFVGYKYRKREIAPIITVLHMIMAAIWPEDSFNASWQVIWANFASWFPPQSGRLKQPQIFKWLRLPHPSGLQLKKNIVACFICYFT